MERFELARVLGYRDPGPETAEAERILVAEPAPEKFRTALAGALAGHGEIFLGHPAWGESEQAQVRALLRLPPEPGTRSGYLMIPTGGTSGQIRFARHDADTLAAAVGGFVRHFELWRVNAVGVLPLHHVSGLMAWLRCALTGGTYLPADWKEIEAGRRPGLPAVPDGWLLSLVPTQLERLLRDPAALGWLRGFRIIFLGGGPAWPELLDRAAEARLPLSLGYGMTETAAMVTALQPEEFLAGGRSAGAVLPHARVTLDGEDVISVAGGSLFRGYYPEWRAERTFPTGDVGVLDPGGRLTVLGRRDGVIITGGEKVHPAEVEAALRGTGEFTDVAVLGLPHAEWGRQVVAAYAAAGRPPDLPRVGQLLERQLAPAKRPKRYVPVLDWPRNAQGKLLRAELLRLVEAAPRKEP